MSPLCSRSSFTAGAVWAATVGLSLLAVLTGALLLAGAGCAPDTDLYRDGAGDGNDPAGAGTAAGALVDPRAGSTDVPWNLAAVTVRLPAGIALPATGGAPFVLHAA